MKAFSVNLERRRQFSDRNDQPFPVSPRPWRKMRLGANQRDVLEASIKGPYVEVCLFAAGTTMAGIEDSALMIDVSKGKVMLTTLKLTSSV